MSSHILLDAVAKLGNNTADTNAQFIVYAMLQMSSQQRKMVMVTKDTALVRQQMRKCGVNLSDTQFDLAYKHLIDTCATVLQG